VRGGLSPKRDHLFSLGEVASLSIGSLNVGLSAPLTRRGGINVPHLGTPRFIDGVSLSPGPSRVGPHIMIKWQMKINLSLHLFNLRLNFAAYW